MLKRIRRWRHRRAIKNAALKSLELREFMYLDEVSVTSLLSSRLGAIPSEFTDTLTDSTRAELNSSVNANAAVIKSSIGSKYEATRTQNSQVLRKASIQATFKDLLEIERESLALGPVQDRGPILTAKELNDFATDNLNRNSPGIVNEDLLKRGRLIEVEIELQADPIFRVSTIISTFSNIVADSEQLSAHVDPDSLRKATELNIFIDKLMAGLVPIKCRMVDYDAVQIDQQEFLMDRRVIEQIPHPHRPQSIPLYLVGVTEQSLFWKDIRRVLFSRARVKALCRLNYVGPRNSWSPVRLVDVLDEVAPELAEQVNSLTLVLNREMADRKKAEDQISQPGVAILLSYAEQVARQFKLTLDIDDRAQLESLAVENSRLVSELPASRPAFEPIHEYLRGRYGIDIDPATAARLRSIARKEADSIDGKSPEAWHSQSTNTEDDLDISKQERFIDAEIIAIYW
ncbi:hypothetical protein AB0F88_44060 [Streptosporangium sp. NPDC023963]|uniref:DUF6414 family protein n=1 Tax=Streptosporangium sp. NPDC023963 TaxID=3155608 RepID=UPI00342892EF